MFPKKPQSNPASEACKPTLTQRTNKVSNHLASPKPITNFGDKIRVQLKPLESKFIDNAENLTKSLKSKHDIENELNLIDSQIEEISGKLASLNKEIGQKEDFRSLIKKQLLCYREKSLKVYLQ